MERRALGSHGLWYRGEETASGFGQRGLSAGVGCYRRVKYRLMLAIAGDTRS